MRLNFLEKLNAKLSNFKNKINLKKGFSLNDLSVMISTVLIVTATSVAITEIKTDSKKSELDSAKFEKINKSLSKFLIQNKRLPCPAGLRIVKGTSSEYGKEQISANNCVIDGTKGVFVSSSNPNLLYGAVPAQSLGLKPSDIEDQFGSKIVYVVNIKSTVAPSTDPNSVNENIGSATTSIKINEKSGDNIKEIDSDALYVLISAGKNKNGAFNANSSAQNSNASTTSTEASNFPTSISGSTVVIDDVFVKSETKSGGNFDDLIFYKTKSTFLEESKTETVITCKNSGTLYDNKNAFFEGIIYANQSCSGSNKRPAKKCGKDGKWTQEVSCPCSISTDGIVGTKSVPNGSGGIKCDATNYSGILQYSCDELGSYTITETCKQSCTFQATGVSQVTIPYGSNKVDCNQSGYKGGYIITCNNGISAIQSGGCSDSKCSSIGGSSGMKLLTNIISGTSSTFGICESGYSGSYSYSCENGISNVTDLCYQNCNFSLIGAETKTLTHGDSTVACVSGYSGQGVSVNCNDGVILVKNNNCIKVDKCTVGVGTGMVSKEVLSDGILKSDGTCKSGFTGSYSYKCSSNNISETTNNCVPTNCVVGDQLGLTPKTVTKGTSGVDGQCASGYGGFYKWSCSSSGVGSVTENNCKNTCIVGGTNGSIQQVVAFGRSGNDGLCDISQGYVGNYSWACAVNASTGMLEGVVSLNLCKNLCTVGTSSQGVGMVQKNVSLNSIGQDGQCNSGSGYVGNYAWKCDFAGNSVVTTNNCKNSCEVGASSQGVGMVQKTVSLNTNGTNGLCNDSQGYAGNYSWSCTTPLVNGVSQAVGSVTVNNCQLRTCVVGGSSGMVSKTVNALTSGTNGTCQTGFYGSYSWSCSNTGVGSVTNNCVAITCTVPANITGFVSGTSGINFGTASYFCNAPGYRTDSSANFECSANPNSSIGTFTQNSNSCSKITCNASAVAGFNAKTVEHNSFVSSLPCDTTGYIGSLTNNCTTHNSTITPSGSCTAVTCSLSAGNGYSAKTNLSYTTSGLTTTCDQTGYTGTISYTCPANPTSASVAGSVVSGSSCACASGYAKNASGVCVQITCTIPSNINVTQGGSTVNYSASSVSLSCASGFYGSPTYTCTTAGTAVVTGTCTPITCTIPASANVNETSVNFTSSATSLTCKTGYLGSPSYTCTGTTNPGTYTASGTACTQITCPISLPGISASTINFGSNTLTCGNGYSGTLSYNCNLNVCNDYATAYVDLYYGGGSVNYYPGTYAYPPSIGNDVMSSMKVPNGLRVTLYQHNLGSPYKVLTEDASDFRTIFFTSGDNVDEKVSALIVEKISNCVAQYSASSVGAQSTCTQITCTVPTVNTTLDGTSVNYTTTATSLTCKTGFTGSPTYTCSTSGTAVVTGTCTQITCTVPSNINVTQGGSTVNATSTATSLTCASGYTGSPTYTCISGVFASGGTSCAPITCTAPASNGYLAKTGLAYTPTAGSGSITCDQTGYTGIANYTCQTQGAVATITKTCDCASGYVKNASGVCVNSCVIGATTGTTQVTTTSLNVSGNSTCAPGYTGFFSYKCDGNALGTVTVNNCYQGRTFVEKTFSFNSGNQVGTAYVGAWWGYEWANNYVMQTPIDYVYATKAGFNLVFNWNCSNYGSWFWPNVFKRSGTAPLGSLASLGWAEFPCCAYGPHTITATPQDIVGVKIANGDIIGFSNGGYTGCNSFDSSYNVTITYMANPPCSVGGTSGTAGKTVLGNSSGSDGVCSAGYAGSYSWSCGINGSGSITSNSCTPISCTVPASANVNEASVNYSASSTTAGVTCKPGYNGSPTYTCSGGQANFTSSCAQITCPVNIAGINNTSLNAGVGALTCGAGYTGTVGYGCGCPAVTSYTNAGSGDSVRNQWDQAFASFIAPTNGIINNVFLKVTGGLNNGGYGRFLTWSPLVYTDRTYAFPSLTDLNIDVSANNLVLTQGQTQVFQWTTSAADRYFQGLLKSDGSIVYTLNFDTKLGSCSNPTFTTTGSCAPITCAIGAGTGYGARTLNFGSGSFGCDAGFTGAISYNCNAQNTPNLSGSCTPITCPIGAGTGYSGRTLGFGSGTFTCDTAGYTGSISYNCNAQNNPNLGGSCTATGGSFTPNWYAWTSVGCSTYAYDVSNNSIGVVGPNGCGSQWSYYFTYLPSWATRVSFSYQYCTDDWNASYDPGKLYVNNTWYDVFTSGYGYGSCYYGNWTNFGVQGGTAFGPGIYSTDGAYGSGRLKFYNIVVQ